MEISLKKIDIGERWQSATLTTWPINQLKIFGLFSQNSWRCDAMLTDLKIDIW